MDAQPINAIGSPLNPAEYTLGIDQSLTGLGWCVHDPFANGQGRLIEKGVVSTSRKDNFVIRHIELRDYIRGLLTRYPDIRRVGVESTIFGAQWSPGAYALFVYMNEAILLERRDVVFFDPSTLKMLVKVDPTKVSGIPDKNQMIQYAMVDTYQEAVKPIRWNHNEADAYHLARFAARFWMYHDYRISEDDLTPSEKQSFTRQHTYRRGKKEGITERKGLIFQEDQRFFRYSDLPPPIHLT